MTSTLEPTERTSLKRAANRGSYDRATINAILDATLQCHVACVLDGRPIVTPVFHWRDDTHVYWHGAQKNRTMLAALAGEVCLTASRVDGLVLARSALHHAANYRSVMIYGQAVEIADHGRKVRQLEAFIEKLYPGRWDTLRPIKVHEVEATRILALPIDEASAKVRAAGPNEDPGDVDWPAWGGVIPLQLAALPPEPDGHVQGGVSAPERYSLMRSILGS